MPDMKLSDVEARALAAYLLAKTPARGGSKQAHADAFRPDPEKAAVGRKLFQDLGCAACHRLEIKGQALRTRGSPPRLAELSVDAHRGCLAPAPLINTPYYSLSPAQRKALVEAVRSVKGKPTAQKLTAKQRIHRTMIRLNCYACHARGGIGGPGPVREAYFDGEHATDVGDEARLPPDLTGVGAKLTHEWLGKVFNGEGDVRPFMYTRMPRFGGENVIGLVDAFDEADRDPHPMAMDLSGLLAHQRNRYGRLLLGEDGLRCITCHALRGHRSTGMPGLDLAHVPNRLRPPWFKRYLLNPAALRPNTRMPAFWEKGRSAVTSVLGGNANQQIEAIWIYLREIDQTRLPTGMERSDQYELVPKDRPIVHRTFMKGVGTHAIAVGYPKGMNVAFDALRVRLALAWRGRFVNAESAWVNRFTPFVEPLSDDRWTPPAAMPFAVLKDSHEPWPTAVGEAAGYRMRGYRLNDSGAPVFLYRFGDIRIEEQPRPTADGKGLRRTFTLQANGPQSLDLLIVRGASILQPREGIYEVNKQVKVSVHGPEGSSPIIRTRQDSTQELLLHVYWADGEVTIDQEVRW